MTLAKGNRRQELEALALPTLKRVIRVDTRSRSARAVLCPPKCGDAHFWLRHTCHK